MRSPLVSALVLLVVPLLCQGQMKMDIPNDFPRFTVPGLDVEMTTLRELQWLHYPGAGPKATLWDEWLSAPAMWPAVDTNSMSDSFRSQWSTVLSDRIIDNEGYVATHQHGSIAHPLGWPFPFWNQGTGGYGWHFSFKDTIGLPWRPDKLNSPDDWKAEGADSLGLGDYGWNLKLNAPNATART